MTVRWFFSLLVVSNLIFAGWLYTHVSTPDTPVNSLATVLTHERLRLLSELKPQELLLHQISKPEPPPSSQQLVENVTSGEESAPIAPVLDVATSQESVVQMPACIRISSIAKLQERDLLAKKITEAGFSVLDKGESFTERQTYWVYIPPYKTSAEARESAKLLARAKVRDFMVIRSGEFNNGISMGLFSQKEGADKRLQEILTLRLNIRRPEIRIRTSSVRNYWLTVGFSDEDAKTTLQLLLVATGYQDMMSECAP